MTRTAEDRFWARIAALEARTSEATVQQRLASGAAGSYGYDPIDGDYSRKLNSKAGAREVPGWTRQRAITDSVASFRTNPMARAIIDTYVAFCVGDSGVSPTVTNDDVKEVVDHAWDDPRIRLGHRLPLMLRSALLTGERAYRTIPGKTWKRWFAPIDVSKIRGVETRDDNPWWPQTLLTGDPHNPERHTIVQPDEITGLRGGDVLWWPMFQTLEEDLRGAPFLMPILDWLDSYDQVLSNLIDRTAIARYLVWDVTVEGDAADIDAYIEQRGGRHAPRSGSAEFHNDKIAWKPQTAMTGTFEDVRTNQAVLTSIAAGTGLSKTWLAEPEDANRATSLTMAEPVRRRIGEVQNEFLANVTELLRYQVDQAVAAGRLPDLVEIKTAAGPQLVAPAETVSVTGPQIAAADAKITADVLHRLSMGVQLLVREQVMSKDAAKVAVRKAWEQFVGVPYNDELDGPESDPDALAEHIDDNDGSIPGLTSTGDQQ